IKAFYEGSLDASKESDSNPLTEILKCPTKVVDEDLEAETKEECEQYGKVGKCAIFEIPGAPDYETVRIFLEFERVGITPWAAGGAKPLRHLNGRYFGGRVVKARFYNLVKFRVLDLVEQV
uniref:RNA recognition motif domain-containing protein n=1 Tax=Canis lupus familiaris TaxID=9615 RepID=A0A8C0RRY5_CANLF